MENMGHKVDMLKHVRWMIKEYRSKVINNEFNEFKANRWLGYIQGVLNAQRIFSILELRDHSRPLYNLELPEWSPIGTKNGKDLKD